MARSSIFTAEQKKQALSDIAEELVIAKNVRKLAMNDRKEILKTRESTIEKARSARSDIIKLKRLAKEQMIKSLEAKNQLAQLKNELKKIKQIQIP